MAKPGKVFLVGAGPGDEELLTLKAARVIENAEVVVYDRLVSPAILAKLPATAVKINVGKNVGNHPVPQEQINQILLEQALAGKSVVRLKGGDSFLFGRGGEELEVLAEHNIEFEVVPGITSALAAAAYAGIPVTHRDFCSSLHIITGHRQRNGELNIDYPSLVKLGGTLIFMMSVANIGEIAAGLIAGGMDKDMPCAVVENGTLSSQRKFVATVADIAEVVRRNEVQSPALIVVGKVCSLADKLDWFSKLPLKGTKILVTRPQATAGRLAARLKELGADVEQLPTIRTREIEGPLPELAGYSSIVFTSAVGVHTFFAKLAAAGKDARALAGKRIAAVGNETAKALQSHGIIADFVPSVFCGAALATEMLQQGFITTADRLLLVRAKKAAPALGEILRQHRIPYAEAAVYETEYISYDHINPAVYDYVTFTSASCVEGFVNAVGKVDLRDIKAVCIGEMTANAAKAHGMKVLVAPQATIEAMVNLICEVQKQYDEPN